MDQQMVKNDEIALAYERKERQVMPLSTGYIFRDDSGLNYPLFEKIHGEVVTSFGIPPSLLEWLPEWRHGAGDDARRCRW